MQIRTNVLENFPKQTNVRFGFPKFPNFTKFGIFPPALSGIIKFPSAISIYVYINILIYTSIY
nr:MAG TPA: hypothetical protein [Caudoviricetes sp.]